MKLLVDSCVFIDAFDPQSSNHVESLAVLEDLHRCDILITMPAHAWFEVQCTLQRLIADKRFVGPTIQGQMNYPVELIHIDEPFIKKYAMTDIPYIKASDHIFVAIARVNGYPLVTSDSKMAEVSKQCGVRVFSPTEFSNELVKGT
ncbi:MAG TPA: PIN domain-containing protein [Verrucomicrobiae bacterium]|nr:PIN domain-containing protein [Verrucomicrobiae bacterium]